MSHSYCGSRRRKWCCSTCGSIRHLPGPERRSDTWALEISAGDAGDLFCQADEPLIRPWVVSEEGYLSFASIALFRRREPEDADQPPTGCKNRRGSRIQDRSSQHVVHGHECNPTRSGGPRGQRGPSGPLRQPHAAEIVERCMLRARCGRPRQRSPATAIATCSVVIAGFQVAPRLCPA